MLERGKFWSAGTGPEVRLKGVSFRLLQCLFFSQPPTGVDFKFSKWLIVAHLSWRTCHIVDAPVKLRRTCHDAPVKSRLTCHDVPVMIDGEGAYDFISQMVPYLKVIEIACTDESA